MYLEAQDLTIVRFPEREHRYTDLVMGPTIVPRREVALETTRSLNSVSGRTPICYAASPRRAAASTQAVGSASSRCATPLRSTRGKPPRQSFSPTDGSSPSAASTTTSSTEITGGSTRVRTHRRRHRPRLHRAAHRSHPRHQTASEVIGVDVSDRHVDAVNRGEVPFVEPDLATHVAGAVSQGMLSAQKETPKADTYIVAVPTPFKEGYAADLSYIDAATDAIIPQLSGGELIILESTSPPGTTEHMAQRVLDARPDLSLDGSLERPVVHFAHCPERVLPGRVMIELVTNDRIIGGLTPEAAERARDLYEIFCQAPDCT